MKKFLSLEHAAGLLMEEYARHGKTLTTKQARYNLQAEGKTKTGYYDALAAEQDMLRQGLC